MNTRPARPHPGAPREYHFPRSEQTRLSNQLRLVVAPIHRLPIVTVLAVIDAGADSDRPGKEGLAQVVARLLLEGAGTLEGAELAEAFESLGASVESNADWDAAVVSMTLTSRHFDEGFALFADVLRRPTFRERELERLKAERLAELIQLRAEPRGLADEAFAAAVYETSSRYAAPEGGIETSVASISLAQVRDFYASRYRPGTTTLIVAGDVGVAEVVRLTEKHFNDWTGTAEPTKTSLDAGTRKPRGIVLVPKDDAAQSE